MKIDRIFIFCIAFFLLNSCAKEKTADTTLPGNIKQQLQKLTEIRTEAEKNDDLKNFLKYYDTDAISMPEYQFTLQGTDNIETFYEEIFGRQKIKTLQRTTTEIIDLGKTIVEVGTFKKEYSDWNAGDTILTQNGKYWNVWDIQQNNNFILKGEAFGFFHPVKRPEKLIVQIDKRQPDESEIELQKEIPFELKAYNALMEKGVRIRDGNLRSRFFTDDGSFMPFADTTVTGMNKIKPYLIEYSSRGSMTIDSIMCYTYDFENAGDYILEYDMFKVKWSTPDRSGRTEGKGIRIWKRQEDKSLKLYREIGTHNHL
jgi:ketosteroid isomerase-like protein